MRRGAWCFRTLHPASLLSKRRSTSAAENPSRQQQENAYASLLRQCRDLMEGRRIHAQVARSGYDTSTFLGNLLVQMYGKCGSTANARWVFDNIRPRNAFSWNIMLAAYTQNGQDESAIRLFLQMDLDGDAVPNDFTYATVLGGCSNLRALAAGIQIHACVIERGLEFDVVVGTALLNMYGKCGSLGNAQRTFDAMCEKDVVAWNAMLAAYAQKGHLGGEQALGLYQRMDMEGVRPNSLTFLSVICACTNLRALDDGRAIDARVSTSGFFDQSGAIQNALVHLYAVSGSLQDARGVLDRMPERNVVACTAIISAYAQHGHMEDAMQLFLEMDLEGVQPDTPTFAVVPGICSTLTEAQAIHACIADRGLESDVVVGTALINMYTNCGSLDEAKLVFDRLPERDVVAWNAMAAAYLQHDGSNEALGLCREMDLEGMKPDMLTFISAIDACSSLGKLAEGRDLHRRLVAAGCSSDPILTSLIDMYSKCGSLEDAKNAFDGLQERNVVAWTAMVAAYAQNGHCKEALELFQQMELEGVQPDAFAFANALAASSTLGDLAESEEIQARFAAECPADPDSCRIIGTALVDMYANCGSLDDAKRVFSGMPCKDSIAFNAMLAAYTQHECNAEALELYRQMDSHGLQPSAVTFVHAITACTSLGALAEGKEIHGRISDTSCALVPSVVAALVNMYGRCGCLEEAKRLFDRIQQPSVVSWNALVAAYAQHGHVGKSLGMFWQMSLEGVEPDKITFTSVLQACSHAGLVDQGRNCFVSMSTDHGLVPVVEQYVCVIDLFGRVGQLDEAERIVHSLPFRPDAAAWTSLLGACKVQGDTERAERAADQAMELEPEIPGPYVLLSNLYAAAGRWEDVARVRKSMKSKGVKKKQAGRSFQCI